ncbi:hypothetical protein KAW50_06995 [candidate division WOR-3 bacterium]|nr:hypothetical protein [candidate division WOR-3 bacterium]
MYPDEIIGIGGAGKTLVKEALRSEWFVEDIIRKWDESRRQQGKFGGTSVRIIDSDTSQMASDRSELDEAKRFINEVGRKVLGREDDYAVKVFGLNENAYINIAPGRATDLVAPDFEKKVKENAGLKTDVWWIDDENEGLKNFAKRIDPNFEGAGFANGVVRKRFLAKALIYGYLTNDDAEHLILTGAGRHIAIVTAFGGGTGSGIFLDMAKWLKHSMQNCAVTLFAVLPAGKETNHEHANAYAALSELERENEGYIDLAILLPLDLSGYGGGDIRNHQGLKSFSETFPYTFSAMYERIFTDDEYLGQGHIEFSKTPYKKFVVASAYIVRYAAEKLKDREFKVSKALETLEKYCETEKELRDKLNRIIEKCRLVVPSEKFEGVEEEVNERLKDFKDCFYEGDSAELLRATNYVIVDEIKKYVDRQQAQPDELSRLRAGVLDILEVNLPAKDKELLQIAKRWLENIGNFKEQVLATESILDLTIRGQFLKVVKSIPLGADKMNLEDNIRELKANIVKTENEINEVTSEIEHLGRVKFVKDFVEKCEERKKILLDRDTREREESWRRELNLEGVIDKLREWGAGRLEEDIKNTSEYYRLWAAESYYNKEKKILFFKRKRNPRLAERAKALEEDCCSRLKYSRKDIETDELQLKEAIFDVFGAEKIDVSSIETTLDSLKNKKNELEDKKDSNEGLHTIAMEIWNVFEISERVYTLGQGDKSYKKIFEVFPVSEGARRGEFVQEIMPKEPSIIGRLTDESDIKIFTEFEGGRDFTELQSAITDSFSNYVTPGRQEENKFLCTKGTITGEIDEKKRSVGPNAMRIIALSRNENMRPDPNYEQIRDIYGIAAKDISEIPLRFGGRWDAAFVTAVMLVPMEMLINTGHYYEAYASILKQEGDIGILKRHSANLEKGKFYVRKKCLNDTEVIEVLDMPVEEQREKMNEIYREINLRELERK